MKLMSSVLVALAVAVCSLSVEAMHRKDSWQGMKKAGGRGSGYFDFECIETALQRGNAKVLRDVFTSSFKKMAEEYWCQNRGWERVIERGSHSMIPMLVDLRIEGINGDTSAGAEATPLGVFLAKAQGGIDLEVFAQLLLHPSLNTFVRTADGETLDQTIKRSAPRVAESLRVHQKSLKEALLEKKKKCKVCIAPLTTSFIILSCGHDHAFHKGCLEERMAVENLACPQCGESMHIGDQIAVGMVEE